MDKCSKCGYEHYIGITENCLKTFYFKHDYYGDEWEEIGAFDHEDAAERFGEMYNEDGPSNGRIVESVEIANGDKSTIKRFSVFAELEFRYTVNELKED